VLTFLDLLLLGLTAMEPIQKRSLTEWVLSQSGGVDPTLQDIKVSSFPTTVHVELLKIGKIPDPVG